jgi:hypothetical protein
MNEHGLNLRSPESESSVIGTELELDRFDPFENLDRGNALFLEQASDRNFEKSGHYCKL